LICVSPVFEVFDKAIVAKILIKALLNLPANDFALCLYLIAEKHQTEEPVATLTNLSNLLETAQFSDFWAQTKTHKDLLGAVPNFDSTIRDFISSVVSQTYRSISKDSLSEALNLKGAELDTYITSKNWEQTADLVSFPRQDTSVSQTKKKLAQNVKFDDLSRILKSLNK